MIDRFVHALRAHAASLDRGLGQPHLAKVTSFDPDTYSAKVTLQPEGVLTGWLPICAPMIGSGWGLATPPSIDDMVLVLPQEGAAGHGVIAGRIWTDQAKAPKDADDNPAQAGTALLRSKNGTIVQLDEHDNIKITGANDAAVSVTLNGSSGSFSLTIGSGATLNLTGGDIRIGASGATLYHLLNKLAMDLFNTHTHAHGPVPDQQMVEGTQTTTALKAA